MLLEDPLDGGFGSAGILQFNASERVESLFLGCLLVILLVSFWVWFTIFFLLL